MTVTPTRREQLQQRCALQRDTLALAMGDVEQRLQSTDRALAHLRSLATRTGLVAGSVAFLLSMRRIGVFSTITRGLVMWMTAKRVLKLFKR